jgi:hypothetical protein
MVWLSPRARWERKLGVVWRSANSRVMALVQASQPRGAPMSPWKSRCTASWTRVYWAKRSFGKRAARRATTSASGVRRACGPNTETGKRPPLRAGPSAVEEHHQAIGGALLEPEGVGGNSAGRGGTGGLEGVAVHTQRCGGDLDPSLRLGRAFRGGRQRRRRDAGKRCQDQGRRHLFGPGAGQGHGHGQERLHGRARRGGQDRAARAQILAGSSQPSCRESRPPLATSLRHRQTGP